MPKSIVTILQREGWTINQESDGYHMVEPNGEESFFVPTVDEMRRYFTGKRYRQSRGWVQDGTRPSHHICECGEKLSEHYSAMMYCPGQMPRTFSANAETRRRFPEQYAYLNASPLCPVHGDVRDTSMSRPGGECSCG